jgi:hypothetical protein
MRVVCSSFAVAVLAACAQNQAAADLYNQAESGSTWQLTINDPQGIQCPTSMVRIGHLPDGSANCGSGCTCSFSIELCDNGDAVPDYSVDFGYVEGCPDGSSLECDDMDPEDGDPPGFCNWTPAVLPNGVQPTSCTYDFTVTETANH